MEQAGGNCGRQCAAVMTKGSLPLRTTKPRPRGLLGFGRPVQIGQLLARDEPVRARRSQTIVPFLPRGGAGSSRRLPGWYFRRVARPGTEIRIGVGRNVDNLNQSRAAAL